MPKTKLTLCLLICRTALDLFQILNFCMLCAVSVIWRPSPRSALLAYSKQVRCCMQIIALSTYSTSHFVSLDIHTHVFNVTRRAVSGFGLTKHQAANRLFTTLRHAVLCPYVCVQFSLPHPRWAQKKRMALKWTQSSFRDREEDNSPSGRTSRSTMGATTTSTWKKERLTAKAVLGATPISNPRGTQTSRRKTLFKGRLCGAEPVSLVFQ